MLLLLMNQQIGLTRVIFVLWFPKEAEIKSFWKKKALSDGALRKQAGPYSISIVFPP